MVWHRASQKQSMCCVVEPPRTGTWHRTSQKHMRVAPPVVSREEGEEEGEEEEEQEDQEDQEEQEEYRGSRLHG